MKIARLGFFGNTWMCLCGNKTRRAGFYPVNARGEYCWHPFRQSAFYACGRCGRMIERKTMDVVGVTPNFRLNRKDVWLLLVGLQEDGRRPVGVELRTLIMFVAPRLRPTLSPLAYHADRIE